MEQVVDSSKSIPNPKISSEVNEFHLPDLVAYT
jgi:hypothetical protein